jgi:membrane-associated phospholipid phosphatase
MTRPEPLADTDEATGSRRPWLADAQRIDEAIYRAVAATPTPTLDRGLRLLSNSASYSRLWFGTAGVLALVGGAGGRRAAAQGLTCLAVTSAVVNVAAKQAGGRPRPNRSSARPAAREVRMPTSSSFPSGHSASAFAFAAGVGHELPIVAVPLHVAAGLVAYSRVHGGVHYPGDVVVGSLLGTALAQITSRAIDRYVDGPPGAS